MYVVICSGGFVADGGEPKRAATIVFGLVQISLLRAHADIETAYIGARYLSVRPTHSLTHPHSFRIRGFVSRGTNSQYASRLHASLAVSARGGSGRSGPRASTAVAMVIPSLRRTPGSSSGACSGRNGYICRLSFAFRIRPSHYSWCWFHIPMVTVTVTAVRVTGSVVVTTHLDV